MKELVSNDMTEATRCPECGAELRPGRPKGLCPHCALKGALELSADLENPLELPRRFGDYVLLEEIARGGMGVVYRSRQVSLDRVVAVKMILAGPFANREFIQRFRAEAQATASLQHPHIVSIHEVGEHEGQHFYTMDYIEGESLAERVRDRPLPARQAAQYLKTIAEAVHHAHERGILHRDLKPSNVLIDTFAQPRITDFGLAKRLNDESDLTVSGKALGSPCYMPPEQALGERKGIGPHSDVYAMGALLYHLLTGRAPFSAETMEATLMQVVHNEPASPRILNPTVPRDLETICLKSLDKEPARRYRTAQALADELGRFLNGEAIQSRPIGTVNRLMRWCRRNPLVAGLQATAAILFLAGFSGVLWQWWRAERLARSESAERTRAQYTATQLELERAEDLLERSRAAEAVAYLTRSLRRDRGNHVAATRLLSILSERSFPLPSAPPLLHAGPVTYAEFSPDGQYVITASRDKTARLWDASGQPRLQPLQHNDEVEMARFSPDGLMIATVSKDKMLRLWDSTSARLIRALAHDAEITFLEFSPDGDHLLTISGQIVVNVWVVRTGELATEPLKHRRRVTSAHFSPDGDKFLIATDTEARVWETATGKAAGPTLKDRSLIQAARFSPDGTMVLAAYYQHNAKIWDWATGRQAGKTLSHPGVVHDAAFSPDGLLIVTGCRDGMARLWNAQTGDLSLTTPQHRTWVMNVQFSDDALKLLTLGLDNAVYVSDTLTGKALCEPIQSFEPVLSARFSPDGRRLIVAYQNNLAQIWDIQPGENRPLIVSTQTNVSLVEFSRDGSVLFAGQRNGIGSLWNPRSGDLLVKPLQHRGAIVSACFSADGERLLTGSEDWTARVWDVRTGSNLLQVTNHTARVISVDFSPKGDLFATASFDRTARVWDILSGVPVSPPLKHNGRVWSVRFSPDGTRVLTGSDHETGKLWKARTGELIAEYPHGAAVPMAAFAPDGTKLITCSSDFTARIWEVETRRLIHVLKHSGPVTWASFSPDGHLAATASYDNTARFWDVHTGHAVGDRMIHQGHVQQVMFSQDGSTFATASYDRTTRLWAVPSGRPFTSPLRAENGAGWVSISDNGRWTATRSSGTVWEIPLVREPVPEWVIVLAEAVAGHRLDEAGTAQPTDRRDVVKIRRDLNSMSDLDIYRDWAHWFLADRATRTISPFSLVTTRELLERGNQSSSVSGFIEALHFCPTNDLALIRLARRLLEQENLLHAERCLRLAARVAPNAPDLWRVRSAHSEKMGNLEAAITEIARAIELQSGRSEFWHYKGRLLEKVNRIEEACDAYASVIALSTNSNSRIHTNALSRQYDLLVRLNRRAEAQAIRLLMLKIPPRDPLASTNCIDLSPFYNSGLNHDWHNPPAEVSGWNLSQLPDGRRVLGDIEFDVRGLIQLHCEAIERDFPNFPKSVSPIVMQRRCRALHFLHAAIWARALPKGTEVGNYVVHYANGEEQPLPIIHGDDMLEWQVLQDDVSEVARATVVWRGKTAHGVPIRLFKRTWQNPRPEVEIIHLSFHSGDTAAAPFLVALTAEP